MEQRPQDLLHDGIIILTSDLTSSCLFSSWVDLNDHFKKISPYHENIHAFYSQVWILVIFGGGLNFKWIFKSTWWLMELRHDRCVCKREQTLRCNEGDGEIQMKFGGSLLYAAIWWIRYSWAVTGPAKVCRWPASPNVSRLPGGVNGRHTSTALVSAVATGTSAARRDLMIGVCKGNEDVWGLSPSSRWTDESGWKKEISVLPLPD